MDDVARTSPISSILARYGTLEAARAELERLDQRIAETRRFLGTTNSHRRRIVSRTLTRLETEYDVIWQACNPPAIGDRPPTYETCECGEPVTRRDRWLSAGHNWCEVCRHIACAGIWCLGGCGAELSRSDIRQYHGLCHSCFMADPSRPATAPLAEWELREFANQYTRRPGASTKSLDKGEKGSDTHDD